MLAYVFWHRPLDASTVAAYEQAELAFHHSLARARPAGMRGSAVFRVAELPWLAPATAGAEGQLQSGAAGYEDWYLVEDYTALGILNEAAVAHGHRTVHDELARRFGAGAGGLYGLVEGELASGLDSIGAASIAIWVARTPGTRRLGLGELLGDGMDPARASLWRRQLVFGPAPEFCLLAHEPPAGAAPTRLPSGWSARTLAREAIWHG
ncbi:MAG TPA: hypothetical protein VGL37_08650 [Solirubrobacteraceae bacterium]|jgi:hypothetical protein